MSGLKFFSRSHTDGKSFLLVAATLLGVLTRALGNEICVCNQLTCESPSQCPYGLALDQCGCCLVCARGRGDTCGGGQGGPGGCGSGLQCVISARPGDIITGTELGTCQEIPPNCDTSTCDSVATHRCPSDSVLVYNGTQNNACCKTTFECRCDMSHCKIPRCNPGYTPRISSVKKGRPGSCCNLYECHASGCVSSQGHVYKESEVWKEGDDCTTCRCVNSKPQCQAEMCVKTCLNPKPVPGRCCPDCDTQRIYPNQSSSKCHDLSSCNVTCETGLQQTPDGCHTCKCKPDGCYKDCRYGYLYDEMGIQTCECIKPPPTCPSLTNCSRKCNHGYKLSKKGCPKCRCNKCQGLICDKVCIHGFQRDKFGCKICKCLESLWEQNCTVGTEVYQPGQTWEGEDCLRCICRHNGTPWCEPVTCPMLPCPIMVKKEGQCCPVCFNVPIIPLESVSSEAEQKSKSETDQQYSPDKTDEDIKEMEEKYIISLSIVGTFLMMLLILVFVLLYLKLKQRHQASWSVAGQDSYCKCPLFIGHSPTLQHKYNINGDIPNKLGYDTVVVQKLSHPCVEVALNTDSPSEERKSFLSEEEKDKNFVNDDNCVKIKPNYSYNEWAAM